LGGNHSITEQDDVVGIVPSLILMDSAMMSIILLASSYFFESRKNTIKTLLVTPVENMADLTSKGHQRCYFGIILRHHRGINPWNWLWTVGTVGFLLMYIVLIVTSHTAIGKLITMYSKDFSTMLTNYMLFAIFTIIPTFLLGFGVIPENWELFMLVSPTQGADV
jgi:hypothetical protein